MSTWVGSSTGTYPLPFSPSFPRKLSKILVGTLSFSSFRLSSANTVWEALPSANLVVAVITSRIIWAVSTTGFSGE